MSIYVGSAAINRAQGYTWNKTIVNKDVPATETGTITSVEIYAMNTITDVKVAIFYRPDPTNFPNKLSTRDSEIIGNVTLGYTIHGVNLDVVAGDYIGIFYTAGNIDACIYYCPPTKVWEKDGDNIPCTNTTFIEVADSLISLYGRNDVLPSIVTNVVTGIRRADPSEVVANGNVTFSGGDITTRGFKYGLTEADTWNESETGTYSAGAFSLTLTGLTADTTYFIRAYADNVVGRSYGSYAEFKTAYPYGANKTEIKSEATASDTDIDLVGGKRSLTINNHLIQTQTIADIISAAYLADYKDQKTKLRVTKPTPAPYEVGDTIFKEGEAAMPYADVNFAVISYAAAADAVHYYKLAGNNMLIRKLNVSFSAGNYISVLELEN